MYVGVTVSVCGCEVGCECGCIWVSVGACGRECECGCMWVYVGVRVGVCGWLSMSARCHKAVPVLIRPRMYVGVSVGACGCMWVYVGGSP